MGYELNPSQQGKGYMQESVAEVIRFAFDGIGLKNIKAYTNIENDKSVNLLKKFNFLKNNEITEKSHFKEGEITFAVYMLKNNNPI